MEIVVSFKFMDGVIVPMVEKYTLSNRPIKLSVWVEFRKTVSTYYSAGIYGKMTQEIETALLSRALELKKEIEKVNGRKVETPFFGKDE
ncbi:MAG: hypothetical protein KKD44_29405 [Proteobacteria bacterium]|nr:hypothetical protein [Pseudomonadota bacterium]